MPPAVGDDVPVIDGSTSTRPLRMFIACAILQTPCDWQTSSTGTREVLPEEGTSLAPFREAVPSSGTHGSYVALVEGRAELILTARMPNQDELDLAGNAGMEFDITPVALDGFVFLVNDANRVASLEVEQIRRMFAGTITNWSEVGGDDRPVNPYQRNPTSGSQVLMERLVMKGVPMVDAPNMMLPSMMAPFDATSRDVDGIGYSVYYYATHMLLSEETRLLRIDGIEPSPLTIRAGTYPLVTEVYAVLAVSASETTSARILRDWLLSESGQDLIDLSGYVPLP